MWMQVCVHAGIVPQAPPPTSLTDMSPDSQAELAWLLEQQTLFNMVTLRNLVAYKVSAQAALPSLQAL